MLKSSNDPQLLTSTQLVDNLMDTGNGVFSGFLFRLVGFRRDKQSHLKQLVAQGGGTVVQSGADFNVLPIQMDISMESSASRGNFVSELYIKECLQLGRVIKPDYYHSTISLLPGASTACQMVLAIRGVDNDFEHEYLSAAAEVMGATVLPKFNWTLLTHVVLSDFDGKKFACASHLKCPVLPVEWLRESAKEGRFLQVELYRIKTVFDELAEREDKIARLEARIAELESEIEAESETVTESETETESEAETASAAGEGGIDTNNRARNHKTMFDSTPDEAQPPRNPKRTKKKPIVYRDFGGEELKDYRRQELERVKADLEGQDYIFTVNGTKVTLKAKQTKPGNTAPKQAKFMVEDAPVNVGFGRITLDTLTLLPGRKGTAHLIAEYMRRSQFLNLELINADKEGFERRVSDALGNLKKDADKHVIRIGHTWHKQ